MTPTWEGRVVRLFVSAGGGEPMEEKTEVKAIEGVGLDGDRYAIGAGTFSDRPGSGRHVTLIEAEAIEAVNRDGLPLEASETRRNLVTEGVPLNHLVGHEFRVGDVVLIGTRLNEPCATLEERTRPGIRRALVHRGGLRAEVVSGGTIRAGDPIVP